MKFSTFLASTAIAALLAVPAAAVTIDISGYNPGGDGAVTGALNLTVSGGTATSGTATLAGGMLSPSPVSFSLVTANCCGYPNNPPSQFTGWRAGDGTDDFNFNVNYPIDTNGIVFESGPWGAAGTYVFGIYSNGSGGYEADLFGPGGANNYYTVGAPISLTVAAVPEPSTWALMVVGFLGLGGASYFARRRQTAAACPA
jgi:hypothetical protein